MEPERTVRRRLCVDTGQVILVVSNGHEEKRKILLGSS